MDELRRLVSLVVERSSKSLPLINQQDDNNLETKLFSLIKGGEIETDENAAVALYGNQVLSASYRMLKSRLRKKLFNQLHFLDFPESRYRASSIKSYNCSALLLEAQCLILANEYSIAEKLLHQAIAIAKSYELNDTLVKALELKQSINITTQTKKAYEETRTELQKCYEVESKERAALQLYQFAVIELSTGVTGRNKFMPEIPKVLEKINSHWEESQSSQIFNAYHILSIQYLELCGDYKGIADAVEKAERLLKKGRINPGWFNHKYNYFIRIYALLQTKQYELGISLAGQYLQDFEPNTLNWFAFMENYLLLALHSKNYDLAGELMHEALSNPHVLKIQNTAKERWELYRSYLLLMHAITPTQTVGNLPQNVLTELVVLPKDKVGFNLSLLILDIIKSFSFEHIDDYESHAERIRKYIVKYMRGEKAERPRLFLRLLLLVMREGLDPVKVQEKGQKLYDKLNHTAPPGDAFAEVEIVPYEHLWEVVLRVLQQRERV